MKDKKVKRLLEKINHLYKHQEIDGELSTIEHDLMLSYIRDLYEQYAFSKEGQSHMKVKDSDQVKTEKVKEEKIVVAPVEKVVEVKKPEPVEIVPDPEPVVKEEVTKAPVKEKEEKEEVKVESSSELDALFGEVSISDLSDKLASSPIKDLGKAMGINERIFTIQELFGGDQDLFTGTVDALNGFNSFTEAAFFLKNGVASTQDWTSKDKMKKATHFIKLVRRRYS